MSQHYSDPTRELEPTALPDVEVFNIRPNSAEYRDDNGDPLPAGWYYWFCFPGCLPDSDPIGPFKTRQAAIDDAQENNQ